MDDAVTPVIYCKCLSQILFLMVCVCVILNLTQQSDVKYLVFLSNSESLT